MQTPEPTLQALSGGDQEDSTECEQVFLFSCCIGITEGDGISYNKLRKARYCASDLMEDSTPLYNLNLLITRLNSLLEEDSSRTQSLTVFTDDPLVRDDISVPLYETGCRVSYFPLKNLRITICIVHEVVKCFSEVDLFIEEQDFLYNCMEIQDEIFIVGSSAVAKSRNREPVAPEVVAFKDASQVDHELEMMQSLISKYSRSDTFKTTLAG
jgi:hypothetical protein